MRRLAREDGQILPLVVVVVLAVLLGLAALVIDLGRVYVVKRQLQSAADASALAGAGRLPNGSAAVDMASAYGAKNPLPNVAAAQSTQVWCLRSVPYCYGNAPGTQPANQQGNGIVVQASASVSTSFARVFGVDSVNVTARSTACGGCGGKPLDLAIVVDRTGSMQNNMTYLRSGLKTLLNALDPASDYVTLLVLPPVNGGDVCAAPTTNVLYPNGSDTAYTAVRMSRDYKNADGTLNTNSALVKAIDCMQPGGATHYKQALIQARDELLNYGSGRAGVQRALIFESDGAANTVPASYETSTYGIAPGHADDVRRPCGSGLDYANTAIKPAGIDLYTVMYAVQLDDDCYQASHYETSPSGQRTLVGYRSVRESTTAAATLQAMASPNDAFTQSTQTDMAATFQQVANRIRGASLVPDSEAG